MGYKHVFIVSVLLFAASANAENRLSKMISPVTNPANFEDPRQRTEVRPLFMHHEFQDNFVTEGGDVQLYAVQLRFAVSDDTSIIATKDGFIDFNPDANVPEDTGFADLEVGLKHTLSEDVEEGHIFTGHLRFTAPVGDDEVFQGEGDGGVNIGFSGAEALNERFNLMYGTTLRVPFDSDDSMFWDVSFQFDTLIPSAIGDVHPAIGMNFVHVVDAGGRLPIDDEGFDLFNFGATEAEAETMATLAIGARAKVSSNVSIGAAYEFPMNNDGGNDVTESRVTVDAIVSF